LNGKFKETAGMENSHWSKLAKGGLDLLVT
jgi:hypothetical protein